MRKIRITTDNTPVGTHVYDDNTGEEIKATSVSWGASVRSGPTAWMTGPDEKYAPVEIVSINGNDTVTLREMVRQAESDLEAVRRTRDLAVENLRATRAALEETRRALSAERSQSARAEAERDNAIKDLNSVRGALNVARAQRDEAREQSTRNFDRATKADEPVPHKFKVGDRVVHFYSGAGVVTELCPGYLGIPGYRLNLDRDPSTKGGIYSEKFLTAEEPPVEYRIGDKVFALDKLPAIVVGFSASVYGTVYSIRYVGQLATVGGWGPKYLSKPEPSEWTLRAVAILVRKFDEEIERPGGTWAAAQAFHKKAVKLLQGWTCCTRHGR